MSVASKPSIAAITGQVSGMALLCLNLALAATFARVLPRRLHAIERVVSTDSYLVGVSGDRVLAVAPGRPELTAL